MTDHNKASTTDLKHEHAALCYSPAGAGGLDSATGQKLTPRAEVIHMDTGSPEAEKAFDALVQTGQAGHIADHVDRVCKAGDFHGAGVEVKSKIDQRAIEDTLRKKGLLKGPGIP